MYPVNPFQGTAMSCEEGGGCAKHLVKDTQLRVTMTLLWSHVGIILLPISTRSSLCLSQRSNWPVPSFDDMQATWGFTRRERDMAPVSRYILRWSWSR